MTKFTTRILFAALALFLTSSIPAKAQVKLLIAKGTLTSSRAGSYTDLSGLKDTLENGASDSLLGGLGSAITHVSGDTFLALPDRGPNAIDVNPQIDMTASYIDRFHTISMHLAPSKSATGLPFTITPELKETTLLSSFLPLVYGSGATLGVPSGRPAKNDFFHHYFTGRSDNFDPSHTSEDPFDARLDPEGIRISNDGLSVFISDEYGPYVYQFSRITGERLRAFKLPSKSPSNFFASVLSPVGATEIAGNTEGRVANKGMEGLAITPDGRTLVGIMQNALIQDANQGSPATNLLRIVTIDIARGVATHQFAYLLTSGSGVSEITALNDHEFLVDERDGKGLGDTAGSKAKVKQIFKIDLEGAVDISDMDGLTAATHAVSKTLFLDVVAVLTANGFATTDIPAKLEGISFGPDVELNGQKLHTFWVANDNDFEQDFAGPGTNPNQFFVFGVSDADLGGSKYVPQANGHIGGFPFDPFVPFCRR